MTCDGRAVTISARLLRRAPCRHEAPSRDEVREYATNRGAETLVPRIDVRIGRNTVCGVPTQTEYPPIRWRPNGDVALPLSPLGPVAASDTDYIFPAQHVHGSFMSMSAQHVQLSIGIAIAIMVSSQHHINGFAPPAV